MTAPQLHSQRSRTFLGLAVLFCAVVVQPSIRGAAGPAAIAPGAPEQSCPAVTFGPVASLPSGVVGTAYGPQALTASGGTAPYSFAVTSGALPNALALSLAGVLSGTPGVAGIYSFTVQVTDAKSCTGSQDLALVVNTQSNSDTSVMDAAIERTIRLSPAASTDDSAPAGTLLSGHREWILDILNHDASTTFTNPTIHIVSNLNGVTGTLSPPGTSTTFPIAIAPTAATLSPSGATNGSDGLRQDIVNTTIAGMTTPGFDSSRSMSPLTIPPGGGTQTVTVSMKLVDPRFVGFAQNLNVNVFGDCQSVIPPSNLDQGEQASSGCTGGGSGAGSVSNAQLNKEYVFTVVLKIPNGGLGSVVSKPAMSVQSTVNRVPGGVLGSSVSIADNLLGGGAVFSVDETTAEWHPRVDDSFIVDYPGMYVPNPVATTTSVSLSPGTSLISGQQQSVDLSVSGVAGFPPTGSFTMTVDNGGPVSRPVSVGGPTTFGLGSLPVGNHTVNAAYSGDSNYSGSSGSLMFAVVTAPNNPPNFLSPPSPQNGSTINATAGTPVTFTVAASDPDFGDTVMLTLSGSSSLPQGATFSSASGNPAQSTFTWTPGSNQVGSYPLTFLAVDTHAALISLSVTINVIPPPTFSAAPTPVPPADTCLCTPLIGIENHNVPTQNWYVQADASGTVNVSFFTRNLNDGAGGGMTVTLFDSSNNVVDQKDVPMAFTGQVETFAGLTAANTTPGAIYRLQVTLDPGSMGEHYRFELTGAVQAAVAAPIDNFEPDRPVRWGVNVALNEALTFTLLLPGGDGQNLAPTQARIRVLDPNGQVRRDDGATFVTLPRTITIADAGNTPGQWGIQIVDLTTTDPTTNNAPHYKIDKTSGTDHGVYLVPFTSGTGNVVVSLTHGGGSTNLVPINLQFTNTATGNVKFFGNVSNGFSASLPVGPYTVTASTSQGQVNPAATSVNVYCHGTSSLMFDVPNQDRIAPTTTATLSPGPNANGWNNTPVTVTLTATDTGGSGVKQITYSLSQGPGSGSQFTVAGASTTFTVSSPGTTNISYSAQDNAGNVEGPKSAMVQIDQAPPVTNAPNASPGPRVINGQNWWNQNVTVNLGGNDNCSPTSPPCSGVFRIWYSESGAQNIPLTPVQGMNTSVVISTEGTTTISYYAEDRAGNVSSTSTYVVNLDKTPPTLTLQPSFTAESNRFGGWNGSFSATATDPGGSSTSFNCSYPNSSGNNIFVQPNQTRTYPYVAPGPTATVVTCTASDQLGNTSAPQTVTITVQDTTPPTITVNPFTPVEATSPAGATVNVFGVSATDLNGVSSFVCTPPHGLFPIGTTTTHCVATDTAGNTSSKDQTIIVRDTTPPALTVPANITTNAIGPNGAVVTYTATATDIVDGAVTPVCTPASGATFAIGTTTVNCTATDAHNNTSTKPFTVTVTDTTPPALTVPANITTNAIGPNGAVVTYTATATDIVDGAVTPVCTPASGATFAIGTTTVNCTATDAHNNTSAKTFTVTVTDTTPPVLSLPANMTVEATSASGAAVSFTATATDVVSGPEPVTCTPASGATFPMGPTTVSCSAADAAGNTATGTFTVTVRDTTPPTIDAHGNLTAQATSASGAAVSYTPPATHDVVDGTGAATCLPASGSTFVLGTTTVTCTATDHAGNTAISTSFTVQVTASTTTSISAPTVTYNTNGSVTVTVASAAGSPSGNVSLSVDGGAPLTMPLAGGSATFTIPSPNAGDHTLAATFAAQGNFTASSATGVLHVNVAATTTMLTSSPNPSSAGQSVTFTATVHTAGGTPTGTVAFTEGATTLATAPVNGSGQASFATSTLALGEHAITATYGGSANFTGSTSAPLVQIVFAYPTGSGGGFVIGDLNAVVGAHVTFWGSQWEKANALSGGSAPASFKGFADATSTNPPIAGGTWATDPGNSSGPPSTIPTYMAVLVSSTITKSGSTISGNIPILVIVRTDSGYSSNPGHAGTGTIVAVIR